MRGSRWEVRSHAIRIVGCVDGYKGAARKGRNRPSEHNSMLHRLVSAFASDAVGVIVHSPSATSKMEADE